ncbi:hypothetical protein DSO57_1027965 [Entomophthora muscae]|uniref:Uncharacterized protein n=1 Tax=Entomophthora muscae TaxID=34485 RepID=A0ACC2UB19_9FUNG|nr:hypothetical protein DSO57_1027965 [Entomophthora muscae]
MYCSNNASSETKKDDSFWDWSDPIEERPTRKKVSFEIIPVRTLKSLTLEVLEKNIDRIDNIHNFPRDLVLSFLKKASASSLFFFEKRNPRVKGDTDGLWERHFKGDFPRSNIHRKEQKLHGWRYCYLLAKREEKEKSIRFAKKFKETQEASKAKRQVQVECMPSNHPLRFFTF